MEDFEEKIRRKVRNKIRAKWGSEDKRFDHLDLRHATDIESSKILNKMAEKLVDKHMESFV